MLKYTTGLLFALLLSTCSAPAPAPEPPPPPPPMPFPELNLAQANKLADLPLACLQTEYPNKLGQTLASGDALGEPRELHPAFYGCFDWHSAVHGHWSLVALLRRFPDLARAAEARQQLAANLSAANINAEVAYFNRSTEKSYERTYGWAWLLELDRELAAWDDPLATVLRDNLAPLVRIISDRYVAFLPKLKYAIRTGEHPNTAFGLVMARDWSVASGDFTFTALIDETARRFYANDAGCPLTWEPGGYDFLSPCLEEIDLMRRVLPAPEFHEWLASFLPELTEDGLSNLAVGEVTDRTDGKLVHLDGLNLSRAWVLRGLAEQYPDRYGELMAVATKHLNYSLPNLVGDSYEGGHWLGSFAIYALR